MKCHKGRKEGRKAGMSTFGHKLASKDCKWWVLFVVLALEEDSERLRSTMSDVLKVILFG